MALVSTGAPVSREVAEVRGAFLACLFRLHRIFSRASARRLLAAPLVLLAPTASATAQQAAGAAHARLVGTVTSATGPVSDALVELFRDRAIVRSGRTLRDGRFVFDDLPAGQYHLRVRHLGLAAHERQLALTRESDTVGIEMGSIQKMLDSIHHADFLQRVAVARSRPRHWDCRVTPEEVRTEALSAYARFSGGGSEGSRGMAREFGMPLTRDAFLRDFRGIRDRRECRHLGEALDRNGGWPYDRLRVFRSGHVYFFPDMFQGGMIVGLDGKGIATFVID